MGILSGNPKNEPMHYGEIFSIWQCSVAAKGAVSCYQAYLNHAGDQDLKKIWILYWTKQNWRSKNVTPC